MPFRLCTYNIEHLDRLFQNNSNQLDNSAESQERIEALREVLQLIDPDLIGIVEAPNTTVDGQEDTVIRLEVLADAIGLRASRAVTGFISDGSQEIAILHDPAIQVQHQPGGQEDDEENPRFDGQFIFDTDEDTIREIYEHYRPPLEVAVEGGGHQFNLIVAHVKSKGVFNSVDILHWELENMRARRKLLAESTWIRLRVDEWLDQEIEVVVMGDFNDGPGMDYYEQQLGRSAVEIVMGDIFEPDRILRNLAKRPAWIRNDGGWKPSTARFRDRLTEDYVTVMIDHILTSAGLPIRDSEEPHRIWNPYEDERLEGLKTVFTRASDHFPVTLDLE